MSLSTVALSVYTDDDPEIAAGSGWQSIGRETVQALRDFVANVSSTRSAMEMAINHVFSGSMTVSKKSGTLTPATARILRNWTSDVKAAMMEIRLFGMTVMVVGFDGSVGVVPLHTITIQYKLSQIYQYFC